MLKILIELPEEFESYFEYIKLNFNLDVNSYIIETITEEILSRNEDLKIF